MELILGLILIGGGIGLFIKELTVHTGDGEPILLLVGLVFILLGIIALNS